MRRGSADENGLGVFFLPSDGGCAEAGEGPPQEPVQGGRGREGPAEQRRDPDGLGEGLPVQERGLRAQGALGHAGLAGLAGHATASGPPAAAL